MEWCHLRLYLKPTKKFHEAYHDRRATFSGVRDSSFHLYMFGFRIRSIFSLKKTCDIIDLTMYGRLRWDSRRSRSFSVLTLALYHHYCHASMNHHWLKMNYLGRDVGPNDSCISFGPDKFISCSCQLFNCISSFFKIQTTDNDRY